MSASPMCRFANGVRLTVKPTKFRANTIDVQVKVGSGRLELPRDRINATWAANVVISGGLKQMTTDRTVPRHGGQASRRRLFHQ